MFALLLLLLLLLLISMCGVWTITSEQDAAITFILIIHDGWSMNYDLRESCRKWDAAISEDGKRDVPALCKRVNSMIGHRKNVVNCDWFKPNVIGCDELKYI